ncbi:thiosulfate sulfurtransferase [Campylobacter geochelonis]|uniref:Thiosulfate sulfurtransferase n=2 Tax=Campylobacter geochelonis TaxID=1780362 RepID=A0A128EJK8_9BACT|nr:thiosulfate sulfurtransferase [Campylobacter geochelonis]CZE49044.1 thiosulfate sulfurtransferase [Campylobacter geochelonis]CZE51121.1 thiosulfate sulfurtransferase [Campylobacter geochelonis]
MAEFGDKNLIKVKSTPLLSKMLEDENLQIIDIRTSQEWEDGSVKGAIKITFIDELGQVNPDFLDEFDAKTDASKIRALLCRSGYRTYFCARFLTIAGRKNIINLSGGINEFKAVQVQSHASF